MLGYADTDEEAQKMISDWNLKTYGDSNFQLKQYLAWLGAQIDSISHYLGAQFQKVEKAHAAGRDQRDVEIRVWGHGDNLLGVITDSEICY